MARSDPRPAYHRRNDLRRLREYANMTPLIVSDEGDRYAARFALGAEPLRAGRYEVVYAYIQGWRDAQELLR